jgi:phage baseplate assembly protein W
MGLLRPFQRDQKNDFAQGSGNDLLKSRIGQILGTEEGELAYDSAFGSKLHLLRHRGATFDQETTDELARFYVVDAVRRYERRARITKVAVRRTSAGNGEEIHVKFVPIDARGNAQGPEDSITIPTVAR